MYNSTPLMVFGKMYTFYYQDIFWFLKIHPWMKPFSKLQVVSIMTSVMDNGNSSFGYASFKFLKSIQTLIFLFFLVTGTTLAIQSECYSRINLDSINFLIPALVASITSDCFSLTSFVLVKCLINALLPASLILTCLHNSKWSHQYTHE